jgi:hypothetical protein
MAIDMTENMSCPNDLQLQSNIEHTFPDFYAISKQRNFEKGKK